MKKIASFGLLLILFIYLFFLQLQAIWPFTIDDMYIPLRYARHWADGVGLLWNVGEAPVEGYSSFSFLFLGRVALGLGLDPVIFLKITGAVGLLGVFIAIYCLSRFWFSPLLAIVPALWLLFYKGQIIWSVSGFETTLYQSLLAFSIYFIFKGLGYAFYPNKREAINPNYFIWSGILFGLASMTRPEGPAFFLLFLGLLGIDRTRKVYQLGFFIISFVLVYCPYFIWRLIYFGHLFPNSIACKGFTNFKELGLDLSYFLLIFPLLFFIVPAIGQEIKNRSRKHYFLWLPSLIYSVLLIGSDPIVAFDNRLFLPAFVLLLPLILVGLKFYVRRYIPQYETNTLLVLGSFLLALCFIPSMTLAGYRFFSINPKKGEALRLAVVNWLDKNARQGDTVVLSDTGLIPYKSNLRFIDSYCLNNLEMGKDKSAKRFEHFCHKTLQSEPEIIILTSLRELKTIYTPADVCLASLLGKSDKYILAQRFSTFEEGGYTYEIYIRLHLRRNNVGGYCFLKTALPYALLFSALPHHEFHPSGIL